MTRLQRQAATNFWASCILRHGYARRIGRYRAVFPIAGQDVELAVRVPVDLDSPEVVAARSVAGLRGLWLPAAGRGIEAALLATHEAADVVVMCDPDHRRAKDSEQEVGPLVHAEQDEDADPRRSSRDREE